MRVIICGSRTFTMLSDVEAAVAASGFPITKILSGGARGADELAQQYARLHGILCEVVPARWDQFGKRAGPLRNEQMARFADACIAIWDGTSPGTRDMINRARAHNLSLFIHRLPPMLPL